MGKRQSYQVFMSVTVKLKCIGKWIIVLSAKTIQFPSDLVHILHVNAAELFQILYYMFFTCGYAID